MTSGRVSKQTPQPGSPSHAHQKNITQAAWQPEPDDVCMQSAVNRKAVSVHIMYRDEAGLFGYYFMGDILLEGVSSF